MSWVILLLAGNGSGFRAQTRYPRLSHTCMEVHPNPGPWWCAVRCCSVGHVSPGQGLGSKQGWTVVSLTARRKATREGGGGVSWRGHGFCASTQPGVVTSLWISRSRLLRSHSGRLTQEGATGVGALRGEGLRPIIWNPGDISRTLLFGHLPAAPKEVMPESAQAVCSLVHDDVPPAVEPQSTLRISSCCLCS